MANSGVRVVGLRKALRALESYGAEAQDLKDVMRKISDNVVDEAEPPVLTGATAASIRPGNTKNKSVVRAGGSGLGYVPIVHWSHRPYLSEAADRAQPITVLLLIEGLRDLAAKHQLT